MIEINAEALAGQEYQIGKELKYLDKKALVVRIVDQVALFETVNRRVIIDELYVELLTEQGETVFISLKRKLHDSPRTADMTMRGPEPLFKMAEDGL